MALTCVTLPAYTPLNTTASGSVAMSIYRWAANQSYATSALACQQMDLVIAQLPTDVLYQAALSLGTQPAVRLNLNRYLNELHCTVTATIMCIVAVANANNVWVGAMWNATANASTWTASGTIVLPAMISTGRAMSASRPNGYINNAGGLIYSK
jgi:hypothetical protein